MSVFFAMVPDASGDPAPAFFLRESDAPEGARKISDTRHRQLLDAQAAGDRIEAGKTGKPTIKRTLPNADDRRAELTRAIKREAATRIDQVAPIWRQMNDARHPSPEGEARARAIDAIREASDLIEATLPDLTAAQLDEFLVRANPLWPEID